jgi:hypothetical protein
MKLILARHYMNSAERTAAHTVSFDDVIRIGMLLEL